ncbi:related to ThiJ/PfpI family protein [Phialocephala subalpina]|uniref:Related to ThiJ/PfpI family protein n=1 Tax=Phialocephala subalpina TaxID=576137 RepID=A0A1L7XTY1_9HELO|nr:related to ThiJ/PfpI family protein [Phialocephala subalpina]
MSSTQPPHHYAIILYPGFQALDIFGPLDILNIIAISHPNLTISLLSSTLDPVSTILPSSSSPTFGQSITPTHTFSSPPKDIDVLLVPGGFGSRDPEIVKPAVEFIAKIYPSLKWLLTICTGSVVAAKSGVLNGKKATTYKRMLEWGAREGPEVKWVQKGRWVEDGNVWSSSGIAAGIDLMYAWVAHVYGEEVSKGVADASEYVRRGRDDDPFAERWKDE